LEIASALSVLQAAAGASACQRCPTTTSGAGPGAHPP